MNQLDLEQEFQIIIYLKEIKYFNENRIKKYLIKILEKMMIKDNMIKYYVKKSIW
uniref:Uncharacterized protein ycf18 n=1 Tax=Polysiphonia infestans TaxID=2006978 RepID=A0A1Z1MER9_9FLOR|nr:phycobilisome degradation protein [Polysiphonia infestans]ARW64325.1 phycobilisome degradation protein [Polysiphonia infestans]